MSLFPLFLKLDGRSCLVVGAGVVAESKIQSLLDAGADVRVVAPEAVEAVKDWARAGVIAWEQRGFAANDLEGAALVITATSSAEVNEAVFQEARRRGILCNSVDDPERCDFYYGAVVRRGDLQIAISTAGHSPALAQRLRLELESQFGPEYATWLDQLGRARERLFESNIDPQERKVALHRLASQESFEAAQSVPAHLVTHVAEKEQGSL
jgi:precorrin-2 dehydrogenase/sirohydrochlorin ferrochelatase